MTRAAPLALLLTGCIELQPVADFCARVGIGEAPASVTWHQDIAPLFASKCMGCHGGSGPGPMALTTYAQVVASKDLAHHAVEERHMPPWPPAACCTEYRKPLALSADELAKVHAWFEQGMAEGTPAPAPAPAQRGVLSRVDRTVTMPEPYTPSPTGSNDETRCFLIDWPETEKKYVTGLNVKPGVPGQMHHAIVFVASPADVQTLQAHDAAAAGPGWPCPGGVLGAFKSALGGATFEATEYDPGLGHEVLPGDRLVLQMHYSAPSAGGFQEDRTSVELKLQTERTKRLATLMVYNPAWLIPQGMRIPAGERDLTFSYADEPTRWSGGRPFTLHSANLHMHERGVKGQISILRANGTRECLLQIDAWDHLWQGDYTFAATKRIERGDRLLVSCTFDNSEGNQKIVRGVRQTPADLDWSEEREMCVAFVTASQD